MASCGNAKVSECSLHSVVLPEPTLNGVNQDVAKEKHYFSDMAHCFILCHPIKVLSILASN